MENVEQQEIQRKKDELFKPFLEEYKKFEARCKDQMDFESKTSFIGLSQSLTGAVQVVAKKAIKAVDAAQMDLCFVSTLFDTAFPMRWDDPLREHIFSEAQEKVLAILEKMNTLEDELREMTMLEGICLDNEE